MKKKHKIFIIFYYKLFIYQLFDCRCFPLLQFGAKLNKEGGDSKFVLLKSFILEGTICIPLKYVFNVMN